MPIRIDRHPDPNRWARAVADLWQTRQEMNPALRLCLPAGLTPVPIYARIGQAVNAGRLSFRQTRVFLLDEYGGLDPDDPGRCANMLRRFLLDPVDLPADGFQAPDVDAADIPAACQAWDTALAPGLDLVLLGIGSNGHVGMNEPGTPAGIGSHRAALAIETITASARYLSHDRFPTWGITVGLRQLLAAREVWLLACGMAKADIVARLVASKPTPALPASWFHEHPNCRLILDADAAARLPPSHASAGSTG